MITAAPGVRAIADLHDLGDVDPGFATNGFSAHFLELLFGTDVRLLRSDLQNDGGVLVFRNGDLREVAANSDVGMAVEYRHFKRFFRNLVFATNPPVHAPMRQVIARPLTPRNIPGLSQLAKRIAADVVSEVVGRGEIDFYAQIGERFTALFWGSLFAMTEYEIERLVEIVREIAPVFCFEHGSEEILAINTAMDEYLDLIARAVTRTLARGGNEVLVTMAAAFNTIDVGTRPARLGDMIAANIFDGLHTTSVLGGNALYQLLLSRDDLAAVRADLDLVSNAVAEGARLWSPLIFTGRCALRDLELAGTFIPRGTSITMLWAAGNRDPDVFERPNQYDLLRRQRIDMTFGGGARICPGRYAVRMLASTMLEAVLAPSVLIELSGATPTWKARSSARQLSRLPVTLTRVRS
jgi:cytochrome P450